MDRLLFDIVWFSLNLLDSSCHHHHKKKQQINIKRLIESFINLCNKLRKNILAGLLIDVFGLVVLWLLLLLIKAGIELIKFIFHINLFKSCTLFWPLWLYTNYIIAQPIQWSWCNILCITFTIVDLSSLWAPSSAILRSWLNNLPRCLDKYIFTLPLCFVFMWVKRAG